MKYCEHCGNELLDEAVMCPKCGTILKIKKDKNALGFAAWILMIVSIVATVLSSIGMFFFYLDIDPDISFAIFILISNLVPLAWIIPMTVSLKRKVKYDLYISKAFKVCTLLFVNILAGIFLLCTKEY